MNFNEKVQLIEEARKWPIFDTIFREYLAAGNSFNGAYNHFSIEDVNKYIELGKKEEEKKAWGDEKGVTKEFSPSPLPSSVQKLEKLGDSISNSTGNKTVPINKTRK